jgi:glycosyltransferase involved in cell wall biosynthesis
LTRVVAAQDDMMIEAKPAISILLPVFNGARYLGEQVASILSQTYRDFELLIYDDASTDNSRDVMAELAAADARVKLFGGTTNLGQKHALDSLLRKSTADLLMFSDQDDVWHPGKIAALSTGLGDYALGYGVSKLIDAGGNDLGKTIFDFVGPPLEGRDNTDFLFRNVVSGHAALVRREVVDPGLFLFGADYDWLLAVLATFGGGVVHVPDALTSHRQHGGNQANIFIDQGRKRDNGARQSRLLHRIMRLHDALALLRASRLIDDRKRAIFNRLFRSIRHHLLVHQPKLVYDHQLEEEFMGALRELGGPDDAMRRARKSITKICRGPMHPKSIREMIR